MPTVLAPSIATHLRSGRYVQRERPAASIPSRIQARRIEKQAGRESNGSVVSFRFSLYGVS